MWDSTATRWKQIQLIRVKQTLGPVHKSKENRIAVSISNLGSKNNTCTSWACVWQCKLRFGKVHFLIFSCSPLSTWHGKWTWHSRVSTTTCHMKYNTTHSPWMKLHIIRESWTSRPSPMQRRCCCTIWSINWKSYSWALIFCRKNMLRRHMHHWPTRRSWVYTPSYIEFNQHTMMRCDDWCSGKRAKSIRSCDK